MESVDQQFRQLKENYERMTEGELYALTEKAYDLTEIARQALQAVITEKGVAVRLKLDPLAPLLPEDEDLVIFVRPKSAQAAGRIMRTLAAAGIPSFLSLDVRADDVERAIAASYQAKDDGGHKDPEEEKDFAILCPKCHSAKVVLEGRGLKLAKLPFTAEFQWTCDACGHQWVDEGIVQEVPGGQSWPGEEFPTPDRDSSEELDPK
jgi:DNA-directed RNA polymerase subunit M/transcription elongation factor TFIIS